MTISLPLDHVTHKHVTVIIPDGTRKLPLEPMLSDTLGYLTTHRAATITVLVALGLHRPMSAEELDPVARVCARHHAQLLQHDAQDTRVLRKLPSPIPLRPGAPPTQQGELPVTLNRSVCDAELIICLGVVEPHQYAGFSGGVKAIAIGCAGQDTISALHGLDYLRDPRTTLGVIESNPFRDALERIASTLSAPIHAFHHVPGSSHDADAYIFGEVSESFTRAAKLAKQRLFVTHTERVPWVCLEVRGAKASNVYQASRAATYVGLVDRTILEPGGVILIDAPCPEGMGQGAGEQAFAHMLERGVDVLLAELEGRVPVPDEVRLTGGAQRAYVMANLLKRYKLGLIGATSRIEGLAPHVVPQFCDLPQALAHFGLAPDRGLYLEDVFHAVPILAE